MALSLAYAEGGRLKAGARGASFSMPRISVDEAGVGGKREEAICVVEGYDKSGTLMVSQATENDVAVKGLCAGKGIDVNEKKEIGIEA